MRIINQLEISDVSGGSQLMDFAVLPTAAAVATATGILFSAVGNKILPPQLSLATFISGAIVGGFSFLIAADFYFPREEHLRAINNLASTPDE